MPSKLESSTVVAPGYAGFIPNLKYQIGESYGNATKRIVQQDPNLKKRLERINGNNEVNTIKPRNAIADDRFSDGLIPGYTGNTLLVSHKGFVPRLEEHLGKGYVKTTKDAFNEFQELNTRSMGTPHTLARIQSQLQAREEHKNVKSRFAAKPISEAEGI
ncbi:hypothetical protein ROZALSC1DRAFT_10755 [Rozella allomycis CSF55]|uniref:Ciliary microtubule inner protein 2A-C-like domain-containing protein n=1 Tax=Rozella allomycis (strain CSF55) TaxID=988480 RepID=A0A4P9YQJ2_ROZAC|nr:hypothetical protein ROZALSC1DRAFT_10755 [Rozella allomycis CSF55]